MIYHVEESDGTRKMIGWTIGRTFYKKVRGTLHLYRKLNAWGMDAKVFTDDLVGNIDTIKVHDEEDDKVYMVDVNLFKKNGTFLHHKPHRAQIFLPLRYWETYNFGERVDKNT